MSVPENIEERLIPFVEGVLNPKEREEVEQAIEANPELRREVEELRELVADLREGFASGVRTPQETLTSEEVAQLSLHQGGLENLPGASKLKTRLFLSDDALAEYRMLQSMGKEMAEADLESVEIPPMPDSLRAEFRAVAERESKVVPLKPKSGFWGRATGWLDRIDPKPLTAAAAAFAMLSLGVHFYNKPSEQTMSGAEQPTVAFGERENETPPPMPEVLTDEETKLEQDAGGSNPASPSGVAVFTSDDKQLLKEQADKLLAKKVRYTITEDRILVAEKQVAQAREVLWGDDGGTKLVAVADTDTEDLEEEEIEPVSGRQKPEPLIKKENRPPSFDMSNAPRRAARAPASQPASAKPVKTYDYRDKPKSSAAPKISTEIPGYNAGRSHRAGEKGVLSSYGETDKNKLRGGMGSNSAFKRKDSADPAIKAPMDALKKERAKPAPSTETPDQRRDRLRDLALGVEKQDRSETEKSPDDYANEKEATNYNVSRARNTPPPPVVVKSAPVANAVTIDLEQNNEPAEIASVGQAQDKMPDSTVAEENSDEGWSDITTEGERKPGATSDLKPPAAPLRMPAPTAQKAARVQSEVTSGSVSGNGPKGNFRESSADMRVASIRGSQARVARRYNVVLSVENRGSKVNVYVRPKGKLSKSEIEELRKAIRAELGLTSQDSIIFR